MTDPIADFLTRIRNAQRAGHRWLDIPMSKIKAHMAVVLKREHYIKDFVIIEEEKFRTLRIYLRYEPDGSPVIETIRRISKPGIRVYVPAKSIPRVLNGMGIAIMSTSRGIMTGKEAKVARLGGEVLCHVW